MRVENLAELQASATIEADLVIIGGGPAGLTIAREFFNTSTQVLILESGQLTETPAATDLNTVESIGEPKGEARIRRRIERHGFVVAREATLRGSLPRAGRLIA